MRPACQTGMGGGKELTGMRGESGGQRVSGVRRVEWSGGGGGVFLSFAYWHGAGMKGEERVSSKDFPNRHSAGARSTGTGGSFEVPGHTGGLVRREKNINNKGTFPMKGAEEGGGKLKQ